MTKYRYYFDTDKEAEWLNEMSRQGYALTGFCMGFYSFDRCAPGEYVYQIDFTEGMFRVSTDYREFMADAGVEIVCLWGRWVFLRKRACEGQFKLYTDVESSIGYYTKSRNFYRLMLVLEALCLLMEVPGVFGGNAVAWMAVCAISLLVLVLLREIIRLNRLLTELKARI